MAYVPKIKIPKAYHSGVYHLLSLSEPEYVALLQVLEKAEPSLYRGDLVSFIAPQVSIDKDALEEIVQILISFYRVKATRKVDVPEFVDDVVQSLQAEDKPELKPTDDNWGTFKTRLDCLMRLKRSLGITSKAFDVMSAHGHVYVSQGTRILTDIRPVFSDDPNSLPAAAVVVHTLKLVYHSGDEHKEFFIALDINDVHELRSLLDRAEKKDHACRVSLKTLRCIILTPKFILRQKGD